MINVNDFKNGMTIMHDNNPFLVMEFQHVKPGKGPAFVRTKIKNLKTGAIIDFTFNAGIKVPKAVVEKQSMQFLYSSSNTYTFMNMDTYEQVEIDGKNLADEKNFLTENLEVEIIFFEGDMLGINLPEKIEMTVIDTEPGVKGNTATNASKDAKTDTGLLVKVPLFIETGEVILVSSKDGKYAGRK